MLKEPVAFEQLLRKVAGQKLIAHCEDIQKISLPFYNSNDTQIPIGPEGDFTQTRNRRCPVLFATMKYHFVSPVCRTEIAGIEAATLFDQPRLGANQLILSF